MLMKWLLSTCFLESLRGFLRSLLGGCKNVPKGQLETPTTKESMGKLSLPTVTNIDSITTINANFDKIEQEFQNKVLYRNNPTGEPNTVEKDLDMNGKSLLNVGTINTAGQLFAPLGVVEALEQSATDAAAAAEIAKDSAEDDAAATLAYYTSFAAKYLGASATNPTVDALGNPVTAGASYFNTATNQYRIYNGTVWTAPNVDAAGLAATTGANLVGYNASNTYSPDTVGNALKNMEGSIVTTGTWTPNLKFGTNNVGITYQYRNGAYVKIGKLVFINFRLKLTSKGSSTGSAYIDDLPFVFGGTGYPPGPTPGEFSSFTSVTAGNQLMVDGNGLSDSLAVVQQDPTGSSSNPLAITNGFFTNNSVIHVSLSYITN